ncbi:MAG: peptidylprolyl isomerase [Kiritimatiellales bacterium]
MKYKTVKPAGALLAALMLISASGCNAQENDVVQKKTEETKKMTTVLMKTTKGDIKIELDDKKAPQTVENFLKYVESGHYNGTIFHRVINDFMIQGGGFTREFKQKDTLKPVDNEANNGLKNSCGTIAMARTSDSHSATAQFFINVKDNGFLDFTAPTMQGWGYTVFGRVIDGMDVVDAIKVVPTGQLGPHSDVPKDFIEIIEVRIVE